MSSFLAALFEAAVLIAGLAAGLPVLRWRIGEIILYSVACIAAVILRSALDLAAHGIVWLASALRAATRMRPVPGLRRAA